MIYEPEGQSLPLYLLNSIKQKVNCHIYLKVIQKHTWWRQDMKLTLQQWPIQNVSKIHPSYTCKSYITNWRSNHVLVMFLWIMSTCWCPSPMCMYIICVPITLINPLLLLLTSIVTSSPPPTLWTFEHCCKGLQKWVKVLTAVEKSRLRFSPIGLLHTSGGEGMWGLLEDF